MLVVSRRLLCTQPPSSSLKRTSLYHLHHNHGAKFVPFAGYTMPVTYKDMSLTESHLHTRKHVSLFDVSHMMQSYVTGQHRTEFIESLTPINMKALGENMASLTVFTNDHGGIKDDLIVTNARSHLFLVSNAGCAEKDAEHLLSRAKQFRAEGKDVRVRIPDDRALLALQGPEMEKVLQPAMTMSLRDLPFMTSAITSVFNIPDCRVTRCGYTGEDGVEISVHNDNVCSLAEMLLKSRDADVRLAGLGARDTLRLEAGLCLYGNDIDENRTPIEATLTWLVPKRRRETLNFPGAAIIVKQIAQGVSRKRVGLINLEGVSSRPVRAGATIHAAADPSAPLIGHVTSGGPSPSLGRNIAMAYVPTELFKQIGSRVNVKVGGSFVEMEITKMPFVPTKYFIPKKK